MSFLESILYGFVSGLAEFLPVSSKAHQLFIRYFCGISSEDSLQDLLVHIALLFSILVACRDVIFRLKLYSKKRIRKKKKVRLLDTKSAYDLRLVKTTCVPLFLGFLLSFTTRKLENNLLFLILFLIINGVVLLFAEHSAHGNRDSRSMTALDGIVMGLLGSFSAFPGISRTGVIASYATIRGADHQNTALWTILIGIPALLWGVCFDFIGVFSFDISMISLYGVLNYIFSGLAAFCGGYIGISLFKAALNHAAFSGFAYYSFGAAFLSFLLYLLT